MDYHIIYIPELLEKPTRLKGNGGKDGSSSGHHKMPFHKNGQGNNITYLPFGNGCSKHSDCFTCPEPDCTYPRETWKGLDLKKKKVED